MNNIPIEINDFNRGEKLKLLEFDVISDAVIIENPDEYNVIIEKVKLPLNSVPLFVDEEFIIKFDSFDKDNCPPKLIPGSITNKVWNERVYSIEEFCTKFNEFVGYWLDDYQYGTMKFDGEFLTWSETTNVAKKQYISIWVDNRLAKMLKGLPMYEKMVVNENTFFMLKGPKPDANDVKQKISTVNSFYKMISLRVYSSLPTENYILIDNEKNTLIKSSLLTSMDIVSDEIANLENYFYHPYQFREYSLVSSADIKSIIFNFRVLYSNGKESEIYLSQESHALLSIKFTKKIN